MYAPTCFVSLDGEPLPLAGYWSDPQLIVQFDQPLTPGVLASANWAMDFDGVAYTCDAAAVAGSYVECDMSPSGGGGPVDKCSYAATPPDVTALDTGKPAAPFDGLTVVGV